MIDYKSILEKAWIDYTNSKECTQLDKYKEAYVKTMCSDLHGHNPSINAMKEAIKAALPIILSKVADKAHTKCLNEELTGDKYCSDCDSHIVNEQSILDLEQELLKELTT